MKLVKFKDGTYGVRRGNWFWGYSFLGLEDLGYWWNNGSSKMPCCKRDEAKARAVHSSLSAKHEVIR
jgi:hypothetical protein